MATFKQIFAEGKSANTLCLARVVDPLLVDIVASSGFFDGFWVDCEHATVSGQQLASVAIAARANEMDCIVRIAPTGYAHVTQCFEAGASGAMAAQIKSADHAAEFVSWCRFAPLGVRGLNTGGRDANYTHMSPAKFVEHANAHVLIGIQIETLGALDQVEAIAALDGVDFLFVGPSDLSLALGVVGQFHHEQLWEAIERIATACKSHQRAWGAVLPDKGFADRAMELGCQMPTYANDANLLKRGVLDVRRAYGLD